MHSLLLVYWKMPHSHTWYQELGASPGKPLKFQEGLG